jgi:hypothetical protein
MGENKAYIISTSKEEVYHTSESCRYVDEQPSYKVRQEDLDDIHAHDWWESWEECKICSGKASHGNADNEDGLFLKIQRIRAQKDKNKLTVDDLHS